MRSILDTFLKVRFMDGAVITYRKHWLVLLRKSWFPIAPSFALYGTGDFIDPKRHPGWIMFPSAIDVGLFGAFPVVALSLP